MKPRVYKWAGVWWAAYGAHPVPASSWRNAMDRALSWNW